jgi:stearoyl-CoA desaturase (delta-9 desaturase)
MSKQTAAVLDADGRDPYRIRWIDNIPFWGVHAVALAGLIYWGWSWIGFAIAVTSYFVRMFGITGGYHRYFSHRSYKTSRVFQFLLGLLGTTCTQKGPIWWASHHRRHHKWSDTDKDIHSLNKGFYWSHQGWILVEKYAGTEVDWVKDLHRYPELRFLDKYATWFTVLFATGLYFAGGWTALLWGYFISTVFLWHGTFFINSLAHLWGKQRYKTGDRSKNNFFLALLTMGEGWHNNHHYYQRSAAQGFYWWEVDITYYILKGMSFVGLVWDVHKPPKHVRENATKRFDGDAAVDNPVAQVLPAANAER